MKFLRFFYETCSWKAYHNRKFVFIDPMTLNWPPNSVPRPISEKKHQFQRDLVTISFRPQIFNSGKSRNFFLRWVFGNGRSRRPERFLTNRGWNVGQKYHFEEKIPFVMSHYGKLEFPYIIRPGARTGPMPTCLAWNFLSARLFLHACSTITAIKSEP